MQPESISNLSVLIITLNEELHMSELLKDLDFADEVIVVDSFSTDRTKEIATTFKNVRFIENHFENFTSQRNFAMDQAKNKWVLFIDADERLTPKLRKEIKEIIARDEDISAYLFYRKFFFKRKVLRFSGWQTDKIFRLFKKDDVRYTHKRLVHEKLEVNGKIGVLKPKLIHYSYNDYHSYKNKMRTYGNLKAMEKNMQGYKASLVKSMLHPLYTFLYRYFIRLGFLDGRKGVIICYLNALSVHERYKTLKKLRKN